MSSNIKKRKNKSSPPRIVTHQITQQKFRSAPLPAPEELAKYNSIIPNAAERIFTVFESQNKHRLRLEEKVISSDCRNSILGLYFAFTLGMTGLLGGIFLVYNGHGNLGTVLSGASLTGLVGVFVYGSRQRRKEREAKAMIQAGSYPAES